MTLNRRYNSVITIRPAKFQEIGTLAGFQIRLAFETEAVSLNEDVVTTGIEALFNDPGKGVYFVAEQEGVIAGCFLITYEWSDWRNGTIWWLQSVYVSKPYRRQGIFRKMYDYLIEAIRHDAAIIGLRLYVEKSNSRAQGVYSSLGMNGDHYTVFEWMKT